MQTLILHYRIQHWIVLTSRCPYLCLPLPLYASWAEIPSARVYGYKAYLTLWPFMQQLGWIRSLVDASADGYCLLIPAQMATAY